MRAIACIAALACASPASAQSIETPLVSLGPIALSSVNNAGIGAFAVPNASFGAGSFDARLAGVGGPDYAATKAGTPVWAEGFVKPELHATWHLDGEEGTLYSVISIVAGATVGDGDADFNNVTPGNPTNVSLEEAFIGYTRALPFTGGGDTVSLQFGRQNFTLDDGFLLYLGSGNFGKHADYYLVPRTAFDGFGTIRINSEPVRADLFALNYSNDKHLLKNFAVDQPGTKIAGLDVTLFQTRPAAGADGSVTYLDRLRYITATYFRVYSAQLGPSAQGTDGVSLVPNIDRQDLDVFSLSTGGKPLYGLGLAGANDFTFYGQVVLERRGSGARLQFGGTGPKINAYAFYAEPGYTFPTAPWSPHVYYRYSRFSGARDPNGTRTAYDSFFYGAPGQRQVYGTYYYGEIVGQYVQGNTNEHIHQIGVQLTAPFHVFSRGDSSKFDVIAYDFSFDKVPEGVGSHHFAQEIDVAWEYSYNPSLSATVAFGVAFPKRGITDTNRAALLAAGIDTTGAHLSQTEFLAEFNLFKNF